MQCFILAGGFATRLWPLTEKRAKPLLPLAGKPILAHLVEKIPKNIPITLSTNAVFENDFKAFARSIKERKIHILIEDTESDAKKLGALGAVARWIEQESIDEDILLLAGDNYCEASLDAFLESYRGNPIVAGYDIGSKEAAKSFGTILLKNKEGAVQSVQTFEEKPKEPKSTLVSTGWWILPKATLPLLQTYAKDHPDNVGGIFEEYLRHNIPVDCWSFLGNWKDIGSFQSYMEIHRTVVQSPIVHPKSTLDTSTKLLGAIDIGPKTSIKDSTLEDCIIFGDSIIEHCVLRGCIIDTGTVLRNIDLDDKMLRAGTRLVQE